MKQFQMHRVQKPKKSVIDLSHEVKATMKMGKLYPVVIQECLPGDVFTMNTETLIRLMPMISPMMHRVNVYMHYFRVPNRLIMKEWETFLTGGKDGKTVVNLPKFTGTPATWALNATVGSLHDFMGFPAAQMVGATETTFDIKVSQLPYRAMLRIYDDYYRDQTLVPEVNHLTDSADLNVGDVTAEDTTMLRTRAWEKDYFTSALPWTQRGEEVSMPLGTSAPISGPYWTDYNPASPADVTLHPDGRLTADAQYLENDPARGLTADLSQATAATINELRRSFALQRWLEKNARGGSRLIEHVLQHFGVKSSDARLQRAEYLGGGKFPVQISEVLSTQRTDEGMDPLGTMGGHGVSGGMSNGFFRSFCEEHGYIIGVMSVLPRTGYAGQGIPRHLLKNSKYDFYYKDFAHIGEQPVYQNEIVLPQQIDVSDVVFGYQERYAEYRTNHDRSHGEMNTSMLHWHMNRVLPDMTALNQNFVECDPTERIFAVEDGSDKLIVQMYHKITAIRPVAKFGDPI